MHFPVLGLVAKLLRILGWLITVAGCIAFIIGLFNGFGVLLSSDRVHRASGFSAIAPLAGGVIYIVQGLFCVAVGEAIGVLFAIEANTRHAADRLSSAAPSSPPSSPRAPIRHGSEPLFYYRTADGKDAGPLPLSQMKELRTARLTSDDTMVYPIGGGGTWMRQADCEALR